MLSVQHTGLGAVTEQQLLSSFEGAMYGCATNETLVVPQLVNLLRAFPDPADRLTIRQYLVTRGSGDAKCLQKVTEAFNTVKEEEEQQPPQQPTPPKDARAVHPLVYALGSGLLGVIGGIFIGRALRR